MTKLFYYLFTCLVIITIKLNAQTLDCSRFKNGTFKMTNQNVTVIIIRKGSIQTETVKGRKGKAIFSVQWINSCRYRLITTKETLKNFSGMPAKTILTVDITKTKMNSYDQITTTNYSNQKVIAEMIKIE